MKSLPSKWNNQRVLQNNKKIYFVSLKPFKDIFLQYLRSHEVVVCPHQKISKHFWMYFRMSQLGQKTLSCSQDQFGFSAVSISFCPAVSLSAQAHTHIPHFSFFSRQLKRYKTNWNWFRMGFATYTTHMFQIRSVQFFSSLSKCLVLPRRLLSGLIGILVASRPRWSWQYAVHNAYIGK